MPYVVCGLVCETGEVRLDEIFSKTLARILGDDFIAHSLQEIDRTLAQHVETHAGVEQRDFWPHVLSDAGRGVQRNGLPDRIDMLRSGRYAWSETVGQHLHHRLRSVRFGLKTSW